jgi:hypothetical protein
VWCWHLILCAYGHQSLESPAKMAGKMPAQPTHPAALGTTGRHVSPSALSSLFSCFTVAALIDRSSTPQVEPAK